jgi:hypothetical protein
VNDQLIRTIPVLEQVAQTWLLRFQQCLEGLVQAEHDRIKADRPKSIGRPKATVVTGYLIFLTTRVGRSPIFVHTQQTWNRNLGPTLLLITWHNLDQPLKSVHYWGSTLLD